MGEQQQCRAPQRPGPAPQRPRRAPNPPSFSNRPNNTGPRPPLRAGEARITQDPFRNNGGKVRRCEEALLAAADDGRLRRVFSMDGPAPGEAEVHAKALGIPYEARLEFDAATFASHAEVLEVIASASSEFKALKKLDRGR